MTHPKTFEIWAEEQARSLTQNAVAQAELATIFKRTLQTYSRNLTAKQNRNVKMIFSPKYKNIMNAFTEVRKPNTTLLIKAVRVGYEELVREFLIEKNETLRIVVHIVQTLAKDEAIRNIMPQPTRKKRVYFIRGDKIQWQNLDALPAASRTTIESAPQPTNLIRDDGKILIPPGAKPETEDIFICQNSPF